MMSSVCVDHKTARVSLQGQTNYWRDKMETYISLTILDVAMTMIFDQIVKSAKLLIDRGSKCPLSMSTLRAYTASKQ
jgi:hypothetical protein